MSSANPIRRSRNNPPPPKKHTQKDEEQEWSKRRVGREKSQSPPPKNTHTLTNTQEDAEKQWDTDRAKATSWFQQTVELARERRGQGCVPSRGVSRLEFLHGRTARFQAHTGHAAIYHRSTTRVHCMIRNATTLYLNTHSEETHSATKVLLQVKTPAVRSPRACRRDFVFSV